MQSEQGTNFTESWEGFSASVYMDSVGVATIGCGTTWYPDGSRVQQGDADITKEYALQCLQYVCDKISTQLNDLVQVDINQYQTDALIDFCYNLGVQSLADSTLLKYINNSDFNNAADEFIKWDHAGGEIVQGLLNRREAEKQLFINGVYS